MSEKKGTSFKACKNCRALVPPETSICPLCHSSSFSDEWNGMIIILNEKSEVGQMFGATTPWRYAIIVK
ncbi:DNA-binding protein [Sulfolobus acidocaldarius SUSAZ]|nr:DNA-binding protein [Sulfolobus acidocaldarius SUSAZ]